MALSTGVLSPGFDPELTIYSSTASTLTASTLVTATTSDPGATLSINGLPGLSGTPGEPIPLNAGANPITVEVTAEDRLTAKIYTVALTSSLGQETYAKASNTGPGDAFGSGLALSGDTLAVGADLEDSDATGIDGDQLVNGAGNSGAIYVFTRDTGGWTQQAYVKASNTERDDRFGSSLALSGDTLAVAADLEDSDATGIDGAQDSAGAANSGAVYVFTRLGGIWSQQAYVKASNTGAEDHFGSSVALSGDTLAVGALLESSDATGIGGDQGDDDALFSGAVYVFTRTGGVWSQQAYIKASNTGADDRFGSSVALSGDTLAVGAFGEDSDATGIDGDQLDDGAFNSGAVYVFTRSMGVWTQQAYLKASNAAADDRFGIAVALSGDTLAVGALFEDSRATGVDGDQNDDGALNSGAVYVFTRSAGVWTQQAYLKASNTEMDDHFGSVLALSGDTLAVGASLEASGAFGIDGDQLNGDTPFSGAVYVFTRSALLWRQQAYVKASNTGASDFFCDGLALSGDTLAVGAPGEDSDASGIDGDQDSEASAGSGAVYVLR